MNRQPSAKPMPELARELARTAHAGQTYGAHEDFFEAHLTKVAAIVASVTSDPEVISMAWLHDAFEDTAVTLQEIDILCGPRVSRGVEFLTRVSRGTKEMTESAYLKQLSGAPDEVKLVKLADIVVNLSNLATKHGDKLDYLTEKLIELKAIDLEPYPNVDEPKRLHRDELDGSLKGGPSDDVYPSPDDQFRGRA